MSTFEQRKASAKEWLDQNNISMPVWLIKTMKELLQPAPINKMTRPNKDLKDQMLEENQMRLDLCRQRLRDVSRNVKYILPDLCKRANRAEDKEQIKMSLRVSEVYNHMDAMSFIQNNYELLDKILADAGANIDLENARTAGRA